LENEVKFQVPTWNQIYAMLLNQTEKIRHYDFKPDVIVGVTRERWVPTRILSDLRGIRRLATTRIDFYVGVAETINEPVLTQGVLADVTGENALLVDDIMDMGKSLKLTREHLQNHGSTEVRASTLYYKPSILFKPDFYEKKTRRKQCQRGSCETSKGWLTKKNGSSS
jgi:uncharacterized protein